MSLLVKQKGDKKMSQELSNQECKVVISVIYPNGYKEVFDKPHSCISQEETKEYYNFKNAVFTARIFNNSSDAVKKVMMDATDKINIIEDDFREL